VSLNLRGQSHFLTKNSQAHRFIRLQEHWLFFCIFIGGGFYVGRSAAPRRSGAPLQDFCNLLLEPVGAENPGALGGIADGGQQIPVEGLPEEDGIGLGPRLRRRAKGGEDRMFGHHRVAVTKSVARKLDQGWSSAAAAMPARSGLASM